VAKMAGELLGTGRDVRRLLATQLHATVDGARTQTAETCTPRQ
jgi:hypothetical protein